MQKEDISGFLQKILCQNLNVENLNKTVIIKNNSKKDENNLNEEKNQIKNSILLNISIFTTKKFRSFSQFYVLFWF